MKLAKVIDSYLILERKTRVEFADELGIPSSTVSRWLNGGVPSGPNLAAVIAWLLEEEESNPEPLPARIE